MKGDDFQRLGELFEAARHLETGERTPFLDRTAGTDGTLRAELDRLLAIHEKGDDRLDLLGDAARSLITELADDEVPDRVGPYEIVREIGAGGMGVVYLAQQHAPLKRRVALKVIRLGMNSREVVARFERERQSLARLSHPGIAQVYDAGTLPDGRPYFAMEYVEGRAITTWCDERRLEPEARMRLFVEVCEAIEHAHQKGIIHRDLKPSNILVTEREGKPLAKVIDFGIARADNEGEGRTLLTEVGRFVGTPAYMSPEQASLDASDIDTRTDIYSLGAILYELLVGALPFDAKELVKAGYVEMQRVIREETPLRPSVRFERLGPTSTVNAERRNIDPPALVRRLRGDPDWITMKALEKDRARRYASAGALAKDVLRHLSNEPVEARPPSRAYRIQKFVRRHRTAVGAGALLVAMLIVGLLTSTNLYFEAEEARALSESRLNEVQRMADKQLLADLSAESETLWPALPEREADMRDWLRRTDELLARLPAYRARLEALRTKGRLAPRDTDDATIRRLTRLRAERGARLRDLARMGPHTEVPHEPAEQRIAFGFRHTFALEEIPTDGLTVRIHAFDGVVLYCNGAEAVRINMPNDVLSPTTLATGPPPNRTTLVTLPPSCLVLGRNVLAAQVHVREAGRPRMQLTIDLTTSEGEPIVPIDAAWRYVVFDAAFPAGWNTVAFDDASWASGAGPVGLYADRGNFPQFEARKQHIAKDLARIEAELGPLAEKAARRTRVMLDDATEQAECDVLASLVERLRAFSGEHGPVADVNARLERATQVFEKTVTSKQAAWERADEAVRSDGRFEGVALVPHVGLVPLGADPASRLQEFAVTGSGTVPVRAPDGQLTLTNDMAIILVLVPGGSFRMGANKLVKGMEPGPHVDPMAEFSEQPVRTLALNPFFLSKFEMTQAQYEEIMGVNPSSMTAGKPAGPQFITRRNPVETVSWADARRALRRIGLTLPTEAQWEYAVRAATTTRWWSGDDPASLHGKLNIADKTASEDGPRWGAKAWRELDDGHVAHAPAGTYAPNPWGFHETLGNVREWCLDPFGPYGGPARAGDGLRLEYYEGDMYVTRGGTYSSRLTTCRVSHRHPVPGGVADTWIGVRPAMAVRSTR